MPKKICFQSYIKCSSNGQSTIHKSNEVFIKVFEKRESIELIPRHPDQCYNLSINEKCYCSCFGILCLLLLRWHSY